MFSFPNAIRALTILSLFLLVSSCDSKRFYEENKTIRDGVWKMDQKLQFEVTIRDTLSAYNLFVNVRNSGDYPFSNIYFFVMTRYPDGRILHDTLECQLAGYDGKWLGSGIGSVKFNRFLFLKGKQFRIPGKYVFEVEQAMRDTVLKGIRDIGLRIEKVQSR